MFKNLFDLNNLKLFNIAFLVSALCMLALFFKTYQKRDQDFYQNYILSSEILIDTAKKVNQYAKLTETEIKYSKKFDFELKNDELKLQLNELYELGLKKYLITEIENEILALIEINKQVRIHLKDSENILALKLYKTEFLSHREQIISLIDSTKKALVNNVKDNYSVEKFNIFVLSILCSVLFFIFLYFLFNFKLSSKIKSLNLELSNKDLELEKLEKELENRAMKIKSLDKEVFLLTEEVQYFESIQRQNMKTAMSIEIITQKPKSYETNDSSLDELNIKLKDFVNDFQKFYQDYQLFNIGFEQFNKNIMHAKKINEQLKVIIVNLELNSSENMNLILLKELSSSIENIKQIEGMNFTENILSSITDIKEKLNNLYHHEENLHRIILENNQMYFDGIRDAQSKLNELKKIINSTESITINKREYGEEFN